MKFEAKIERFTGSGHDELDLPEPSADQISHLIDRIAADWSSCIRIQRDGLILMICASNGLFAVTALMEEDEYYDLIGDEHAAGWAEFVHGGQPAMHPRRHCVPRERAKEMVGALFRSEGISPQAPSWERQGEYQSA